MTEEKPAEIVEFEKWLHNYVATNMITPGSMTKIQRSYITNKAASFGLEISQDGKQYKLKQRGRVLTTRH